ncbi:gephyrin-like molybdotransferase receptor GlpR [Streptomyces sp. MAR4 CNX-425]|uniref:gephyrin-like molybdotransferase receptor GlpR n=1 Tax=Streptomyces sp. MAR4 CNX-425 TaxID=3406343 RepID=UPI003B511672
MSSSGLIYAMIVGAWAAYLVPMWLRRQDELNEARPTERFSTAIRLLTGRGGADRTRDRDGSGEDAGGDDDSPDAAPAAGGVVDVRAAAVPVTDPRAAAPAPRRGAAAKARVDDEPEEPRGRTDAPEGANPPPRPPEADPAPPAPDPAPPAAPARNQSPQAAAERRARARVLARRRRTLTLLFVALTAGAVAASVGGPRLLWAVAVPGLLLTAYVVRVRTQERRRRTFTADPARGEAAARRLREGGVNAPAPRRRTGPETAAPDHDAAAEDGRAERHGGDGHPAHDTDDDPSATAPFDAPAAAYEADRRALVEQTDHAEWVDQQRERDRPADAGWDPVPVPLPTYVTAPVAPRAPRGLDLDAPDTWSSARSSTAEPRPPAPETPPTDPAEPPDTPRRRPTNRTPLFDQYADPPRRRAANE